VADNTLSTSKTEACLDHCQRVLFQKGGFKCSLHKAHKMNLHFGVHILCVPFCHLLQPWFGLWVSSHYLFVVFCLVFLYDDICLPAMLFRVQEPLLCFDFCHLKLKVSNCSLISPFVLELCVYMRISSPELLEGCMRCLVQRLYTMLRIKLTKMYRV
jgi:hypothetical protein